ncbi:metal tolerance protein 2-like [Solanum tuberosum]|uniref:metal tolerance protein 2-like n=1 Tax=Solanum tuberosum TaxID=4113 RepID=UPI00073A104C|nr:PREDICTED: metal tolerance protein 2-like [Solanum tuberosum]
MLHNIWHTGDSYSHHHVHHDVRSGMTERRFSGLDLLLILALPPEKLLQVKYVEAPPLLLMRLILSPMWFCVVCHCCPFKLQGFPRTKNIHVVTLNLSCKYETLRALGISGVLLATAGGIGWHALDVLLGLWSAASEVVNQSMTPLHVHEQHHHGIDMDHPILALSVTILSIAVKEG